MNDWKLFGGYSINNLGEYCIKYIKDNPEVIIAVGCDSKQLRYKTLYATTVCFYHPGKGIHIIFKRESINKIRDLFSRLWREAEYSKNIGEYLESQLRGKYTRKLTSDEIKKGYIISENDKLVDIHLDFNPDKRRGKSYIVYEASIGMLKSLGFRVRTKQNPDSNIPNAWAASCCADLLL